VVVIVVVDVVVDVVNDVDFVVDVDVVDVVAVVDDVVDDVVTVVFVDKLVVVADNSSNSRFNVVVSVSRLTSARRLAMKKTYDHGYNDHGYNEFMAITNKMLNYVVPIGYFITFNFTI